MRLDAYQFAPSAGTYVLNKQANLKITHNARGYHYSGSIKLPNAGSWRRVAGFPGNAAWVQSGSPYKAVHVN